jgi:hypothetical protein
MLGVCSEANAGLLHVKFMLLSPDFNQSFNVSSDLSKLPKTKFNESSAFFKFFHAHRRCARMLKRLQPTDAQNEAPLWSGTMYK